MLFKRPFGPSLLLLAGLILPESLPAAQPGTLVELGPVEVLSVKDLNLQYLAKMKRELAARTDQFKGVGPMAVFQQMVQEHLSGLVPSRKVRYTSMDAAGERTYSGRVFLPSRKATDPPMEVPLVIYQHATETRRKAVSYYNKGDETMLGALAAELCGFAVAMPDGDGMGADPSPKMHAYCYSPTTATCLIDMIRAVLGDLDGKQIFDDANYVWDGEIYIIGYSEGGYISMAAVKALSTNAAYKDIKLNGAACMGGPFDLADATRNLLTDAKTPYDRPYIPSYFIAAWKDLFPEVVSFKDAMNPALLKVDSSGSASKWLSGDLEGDQITALIQTRLGNKAKAVPAREILNEKWVKDNIENPKSRLNELLRQNTLVGDWKPAAPVLLVHDPYDETVKYTGTEAMYKNWKKQGLDPIGIIDMKVGKIGTGHIGGAAVAIPTAFIWVDAGMHRDIWSMAKDKIRKAIVDNAPPELEANADALATAVGLQESNVNRALLPLSRIDCARSYTLAYGDTLFKVGKVKLYTIEKAPVFNKQAPSPGLGGYTRLVKEMKKLGDSFPLKPNTTYYMAVYPEKAGVALTLKFTGAGANYTTNIKQVKNKIIGRNTGAIFSVSSNFKAQVQTGNYDRAETGKTFITLPAK
jgi:pimeloyl-ACP methyl ester carboxylesterase